MESANLTWTSPNVNVIEQFEKLELELEEVVALYNMLSAEDGSADYEEFLNGLHKTSVHPSSQNRAYRILAENLEMISQDVCSSKEVWMS